jgi:hypothetical protein
MDANVKGWVAAGLLAVVGPDGGPSQLAWKLHEPGSFQVAGASR